MQFISNITEWRSNCRKHNCPSYAIRRLSTKSELWTKVFHYASRIHWLKKTNRLRLQSSLLSCHTFQKRSFWLSSSPYCAGLCMFTSNEQISPPSLVLNCKVAKFCIKECPKAVNLKRISTQKECKCKEFSLQTRLGGEICSSDVIMHKGHCLWGWRSHVGMSTFEMSWSKESRRTALLPGKSPSLLSVIFTALGDEKQN